MAAVWIILSKTRFPAELIESSQAGGVKTASVPFDISADYLPDLLKKPDEEVLRLSQGLPPSSPEFDQIIHRSPSMRRLMAKARRISFRNIPILISGESGTGKEILSRAIHAASPRKGPFVAVNCGAIPAELVESELFGHEKGAFTGAVSRKIGYIEESSGGTLFLDEVGELPLFAQVKLLRVLQERQVVRIGATRPIGLDLRIISATNKNLLQEVVMGGFREDLFHRIAVALLHIPPLREREGDISLLTDKFMKKINREATGQPGYKDKKISASAKNLLLTHSWPGNVRELQNTLLRAAIWSPGRVISAQDIEDSLLHFPSGTGQDILNRPMGNGFNLQGLMEEVARHYLKRAMEKAGGNKTRAARLLGLPNYQTFSNWMRRYRVN